MAALLNQTPIPEQDLRPILFSTDLLYSISREYQPDWFPHGSESYCSNPLSPFTADIGKALNIRIRNNEQEFRNYIANLASSNMDTLTAIFFFDATYMFEVDYYRVQGNENTVLGYISSMARVSFWFYEMGKREVPDLARRFIAEALSRYIMLNDADGIFSTFLTICRQIIGAD